jgi:hypothetical protein
MKGVALLSNRCSPRPYMMARRATLDADILVDLFWVGGHSLIPSAWCRHYFSLVEGG